MRRFATWIRTRYWAEQLVLWPVYILLWSFYQVSSTIWWLLQEAYAQTEHALREFVRRNIWIVLLVGGIILLYVLSPQSLGPLLQLGFTLTIMWLALTFMWRSAFPRKKRKQGHKQ